jgi:ATP-binding cassette subfamily B protein
MISISWGLTWKTLCLLPFLPVFVSWLGGIVDRRFETVQERFSELAGLATENISGIRLVKTYVQEENQAKIFNAKSNEWHQSSLKVAWPESFMHPVMEFCVSVGVAVLIIWGGDQVIKEAITVGTFFAFHRYISKMAWPMTAIGWGYSLISQARASLRRVDEFLNTPIDVNLIEETGEKKNLNGEITINHLNFNYPSTTQGALHDISLKIPQGTTLGIVGTVGAGKTTLVHLLSGLYKVERGTIVINGVDINDIPLQQLRQHIAVIPQDTFLFSRTVHENIGYGLESLPDLPAASQYARLVSFDREVIDLPNGWNTLLGDRGVNLSGGQKQRLTMARALIRQSSVVIFDDSLSSVDAETETNILRALQTELKGKTAIIVSHRLSAVSDCDQILVLHNGQKEALGTPQEVASSSLTLKELLALQGMGESW